MSNLGVLGRRPEAKWSVTSENLINHRKLQLDILKSCSNLVKKDGVMVYATCSPEPEETDWVINEFLKDNEEFKLDPAKNFINNELFIKNDVVKIIPGEVDLDGFFGARLIKIK